MSFSDPGRIGFVNMRDGVNIIHGASYRQHPHSVACLNRPTSLWVNLVYEVARLGKNLWQKFNNKCAKYAPLRFCVYSYGALPYLGVRINFKSLSNECQADVAINSYTHADLPFETRFGDEISGGLIAGVIVLLVCLVVITIVVPVLVIVCKKQVCKK